MTTENGLVVTQVSGGETRSYLTNPNEWMGNVHAETDPVTGGIGYLTLNGVNSSIKPNATPRAPIIEAVSWTGSAVPQFIELGYKPDLVITKAASKYGAFLSDANWNNNYQGFGNVALSGSDGNYGPSLRATGIYLPGATAINYAGSTHYALVIKDNGSGILKTFTYNGFRDKTVGAPDNQGATSNAVSMDLIAGSYPKKVYIKRDYASATHEGVWASPTWAKKDTAVAVNNALLTLAAEGTMALSTDVAVNENDGVVTGEAHCCFSLHADGTYWDDLTYTGTGAAFTINCPKDVAGMIVVPQAAAAMEFWLDGMGTSSADGGATALNTGRIYAVGSKISIGADATINTLGTSYALMVFYKSGTAALPKIQATPRPGVRISTTGTGHITCGTDASLAIAGAHSMEWIGSIGDSGSEEFIMGRIGAAATGSRGTPVAGSCNYAIAHTASDYGLEICVSDQFSSESASASKQKRWRTGYQLAYNEPYHVLYTHDGTDKWVLYINGVPVKWRRLPMSVFALNGITATAGLTMTFGGRVASGTWAAAGRTTHKFGRIYNRALTAVEVRQMYARNFLLSMPYASSDLSDKATAMVEEWKFNEMTGSTVAATVNAANNGTITAGVWVP